MFVALMLIIQLFLMILLLINGGNMYKWLNLAFHSISYIVAITVISRKGKMEYKLLWVFITLLFPVFGGMLYLFFNFQTTTKLFKKNLSKTEFITKPLYNKFESVTDEAISLLPDYKNEINYLENYIGFPVYDGTETKYLSPGQEMFEQLVIELEKAEKYIFLEYFIIEHGEMWDTILKILIRKAKMGVDVRLLYDDLGCFLLLPHDYPKTLKENGIKCMKFNEFRPALSSLQNNRDHRKIASIDGKVAFTGGINLADEYINKIDKHGKWKDAGIMIKGKAAWSFTLMFLQMWELCVNTKEDLSVYFPYNNSVCTTSNDGFVQPYADSPVDDENVGESVYLNIINSAKNYLYITTPYLVIDASMMSALKLAAKNGVDVRIVTPKRWDKRIVHMTTRSYYKELVEAGIKIYEYHGFIHSKTFVSDGKIATVGTVNLDYRSLYLHFECGVVVYNASSVADISNDFLSTLKESEEMTLEKCKCSFLNKLIREVLRLIAPLM